MSVPEPEILRSGTLINRLSASVSCIGSCKRGSNHPAVQHLQAKTYKEACRWLQMMAVAKELIFLRG